MAARATREVVFDASPEAILDALADIEEVRRDQRCTGTP
jgi:hypothetical protein